MGNAPELDDLSGEELAAEMNKKPAVLGIKFEPDRE